MIQKPEISGKLISWIVSHLSKYSADELSEQAITEYLLKKQKVVDPVFSAIDIGAAPPPNYYPIFMRHTENVYCVEPALTVEGNIFKYHVKKLLRLSKQGKVKLFKGVISDVSGEVMFHQGKNNSINSSLDPSFRVSVMDDAEKRRYTESFEPVRVKSLTYSDYIKQNAINYPFFVKVDTEGAEARVISTMNHSNAPKILLLEVAYDTGNLKSEVKRLMDSKIFYNSLFISRKLELHNSDILGDWRFNEHDNYVSGNTDITDGSLFLAKSEILDKQEMLALRSNLRERIRIF